MAMQMTFFEAREKIKSGPLVPVYLFFGEESYLAAELQQLLAAVFLGEDTPYGREKVEGAALTLSEAVQRLSGGNLFASRQLLLVTNPPCLAPPRPGRKDGDARKREEGAEEEPRETDTDSAESSSRKDADAEDLLQLERFIARESGAPAPQNVIALISPAVDRRKKIFKLIAAKGMAVDCSPLKKEDLERWIRERAARVGKKIARGALEQLLWSGSGNLWQLANELDKYVAYLDQNQDTITPEVVELLYAGDTQGNVFRLADALCEGNLNRALSLLQLLLDRREKPLQIFFMLVRHFRLLLAAWDCRREKMPADAFAREAKLQPFAARRLYQQATAYNRAALEEILLALQAVDRRIKTGVVQPQSALEIVLGQIHRLYLLSRKTTIRR